MLFLVYVNSSDLREFMSTHLYNGIFEIIFHTPFYFVGKKVLFSNMDHPRNNIGHWFVDIDPVRIRSVSLE